MSRMRYPSWNEFLSKYPNNPQDAFQALCRLLFRNKFGIGDSLPYFYNHPGIETAPIQVEDVLIGFQSKFFTGETINDSQAHDLIDSIITARNNNPNLTKIILYTNSVFFFPRPEEDAIKRQKKVEKTATDLGLDFEWMFGDNILDVVARTPLAYNLFFDLNSNLSHLYESVRKINAQNLRNICSHTSYRGQNIVLDRSKEIAALKGLLTQKKNVLIHGESGSGKSAIVKSHWEEVSNNGAVAYYFTRGEQFETHIVNSLFSMDEEYTYTGFRDFYDGFETKLLIIDSAERLTELSNRTILQLIIEGLSERGWQFVFTCKDSAYNELHGLLRDLQVQVSDINVERVSEAVLHDIEKKYKLTLPTNDKLLRQLCLPFYLTRYCEVENAETATPEAFRELVWCRKVRGTIRGGIQQKRENCLLMVVMEQQEKGAYYVNPVGLDHDTAYILVQEDVLIEQPHKGYAVKHDIYVDWTLDYIIDRDCSDINNCLVILAKAPRNVTYRNAFARWLDNIVNSSDGRVRVIMNAFVNGNVQQQWRHTLLASVGNSKEYASIFFNEYSEALKADNYGLFDYFVDVLTVSCLTVTQYFEYEGLNYPVTKSKGSGWEEAIKFVVANRDDYYMRHLVAVQKLLEGYSEKNGAVTQEAAELSLYLFNEIAEIRKRGESIWVDNLKSWSELVCKYAYGIRHELNSIFNQVQENMWIKHTDPYAELVDYVLKDSNHLGKAMIYISCLDSIVALMNLFWREQPSCEDKRRHGYNRIHNQEFLFGLNTEYGLDIEYFPASPFQTPVMRLLEADELLNKNCDKVTDFIIDFMNECVIFFAKRQSYELLECVSVSLPNGAQHDVVLTQSLWNMYRGTANIAMPHVLESMHMALEKYLLAMADDKQPKWEKLKAVLWYILEKSHSASLYGIVASLAVAYPKELYEIFLYLCQDIHFLVADLNRYSHEITANSRAITFHGHEQWSKEREQSDRLPHRQQHLETRLLQVQCIYDTSEFPEDKKRLEQAYKVVDIIKSQVTGVEDTTCLFVMKRIDYRTHHRRNITLSNGISAVELTPDLTPKLKAISEEAETYPDRMITISLRLWADKIYKGESVKGYPFEGKPHYAIEVIRLIEKQVETREGNLLLMPGDEFIPYMASATLLMKHTNELSEKEQIECWERVLLALNNPSAMLSNSLSEFSICIAAIPTMLELFPERRCELIPVFRGYVNETVEFVHHRVCDMISSTILCGKLWEKYPVLMNEVLKSHRSMISGMDYDNMTVEEADAILCLLTYQPPDEFRWIGDICIKKLSAVWNKRNRYGRIMRNAQIAENVARYILFAPHKEVLGLINAYIPVLQLDSYSEPLMTQLLLGAVQHNKYKNFWIAWYAMYERVTAEARKSILNEYLLNPMWLQRDFDDWFMLQEKDMNFFEQVSRDIGGNPTVIYSLSRVFGTIGKNRSRKSLKILFIIIDKYSPKLQEEKKSVMHYMEKTLKLVFAEHGDDISRDRTFKEEVATVLEYMINNGSSEASDMIKIL